METALTPPDSELSIDVDLTLYPITAVMRAAYKFTGQYYVAIRRVPEHPEQRATVTLAPKEHSRSADRRMLLGDFQNELIDQSLRDTLEAEFGPLRELIVAQAFADTNLLDPARDDGNYLSDPLGIGLPGPQAGAQVTPADES